MRDKTDTILAKEMPDRSIMSTVRGVEKWGTGKLPDPGRTKDVMTPNCVSSVREEQ
jgi:hypothetical protein